MWKILVGSVVIPPDDELAVLARAPLLAGASEQMLTALSRLARPARLPAGEWLFLEGQDADRVYFVRSGRLRVSIETEKGDRTIREVGPGTALGELALLTGSRRSASVQALRDSELLELEAEHFESLLREHPGLALVIARELAHQLQRSGGLELPEARPAVVSVVPLDPEVPIVAFWAELQRAFEAWDDVAALDGRDLDPSRAFGPLVDDLERRYRHVLLLGSSEPGLREWNDFCCRQADRVLVLTDGASHPSRNAVPNGCDLVFLSRPSLRQLDRWLAELQPRAHHFVEQGHGFEVAVRRLARRVTRRALGVVLSGGGARGFAHIGVLDVLAGEELEFDRVGGCSFGSFIGAMAALGWSAERMRDVCNEELVRRSPFNDYTFPRVALIRSRKAADMLARVFGDTCLEELARPMFAVSADLLTSRVVVHRRGPLFEAVGASMSIPGLVPPLARGGRLLVDGGVLNNLPVDLMVESGEGPVLAVDVMRRMSAAEGDSAPSLPSIMETLSRATVLGSVERAEGNRTLAGLTITPDVEGVALRDFSRLDQAIDAGRRAAEEALASGGKEALVALLTES
jgi:NTE family protein